MVNLMRRSKKNISSMKSSTLNFHHLSGMLFLDMAIAKISRNSKLTTNKRLKSTKAILW